MGKIGIIDADLLDNGTRHPNLACMKISGYSKEKGHSVELLLDYNSIDKYDRVYISKVFSFTKIPVDLTQYNNIIVGGTGFFEDGGKDLPYDVEHHMPDYHLYDDFIEKEIKRGIQKNYFLDYLNYSIGFASRGCFRQCSFCVNKKYQKAFRHAPIKEFYDPTRKNIYLWDDNILAYEGWKDVFNELAEIGKSFQFRQGIDIRLMTDEKAKVICKSKYKGDFIFAFDDIKDTELIKNKIRLFKRYYTKKGNVKLYVLCAFDKNNKYDQDFWEKDIIDTFERIRILMGLGCIPYIMRYDKYKDSPFEGMYTTLARWCNQPAFFKKRTLREYVYVNDGKGREDKLYASKKYINDFEEIYPNIAKEYYDLRFEDLCSPVDKSNII